MAKNMIDAYTYVGAHRADKRSLSERLQDRAANTARGLSRAVAIGSFAIATAMGPQAISYSESITSTAAITQQDPQVEHQNALEMHLPEMFSDQSKATFVQRLTGIDREPADRWGVAGTDLGIPFKVGDGKTAFIFGDTFDQRDPGEGNWRSNTILFADTTSNTNPKERQITFTDAAGIEGEGLAPEVLSSEHDTSGNGEFSAIPTDGVYIPETNEIIMSYQSVRNWDLTEKEAWATNYSGLAISRDGGNSFERIGPRWENDADNNNAFQMMSMQRDGEFIYIASDKAGRQEGGMMMQRVKWDQITDQNAYQQWNGKEWGKESAPLFENGKYGEPSLRKLKDGTWAMAYLDLDQGIVTRFADRPDGKWSEPKVQFTIEDLPYLYGGFIDPDSTSDNLKMIISSWAPKTDSNPGTYDTNLVVGNLGKPVIKL